MNSPLVIFCFIVSKKLSHYDGYDEGISERLGKLLSYIDSLSPGGNLRKILLSLWIIENIITIKHFQVNHNLALNNASGVDKINKTIQ